MKSRKVDKVGPSIMDLKKDIEKAKMKHRSQMDAEQPGGFQKVDKKEEARIIEGKNKQKIEIQEQLRETEIAQNYAFVEAEELERIYKAYDEPYYFSEDEKHKDYYKDNPKFVDKPEWYGIDMPKKILVCEFNTKIAVWKRLMMKRNYLYEALKNLGFTKEILQDLLTNGKVVSDNEILKKLEQDREKKQLKKDDVDAV